MTKSRLPQNLQPVNTKQKTNKTKTRSFSEAPWSKFSKNKSKPASKNPKSRISSQNKKAYSRTPDQAQEKPPQPAWQKWLFNYGQFIQLLVIAAFFYLLLFLLMKNIPPATIANFPLPGVYLPFQMLLFGGNFFLFTFLWQNKKLGLVTAGLMASLLFWKLQNVFITPLIALCTVLPWLLVAVVIIWRDFKGIIRHI